MFSEREREREVVSDLMNWLEICVKDWMMFNEEIYLYKALSKWLDNNTEDERDILFVLLVFFVSLNVINNHWFIVTSSIEEKKQLSKGLNDWVDMSTKYKEQREKRFFYFCCIE